MPASQQGDDNEIIRQRHGEQANDCEWHCLLPYKYLLMVHIFPMTLFRLTNTVHEFPVIPDC